MILIKKIKELFFLSIFVIANSFIFGNASSTSLENIKENKLLDMNFNFLIIIIHILRLLLKLSLQMLS